jgi:hypothetical protein
VPEISRFFGIVVAMYYNDHEPPHFHARYGSHKAIFGIEPLDLLEGHMSARATRLVTEWASLHQAELIADWELARQQEPLRKIQPLE